MEYVEYCMAGFSLIAATGIAMILLIDKLLK